VVQRFRGGERGLLAMTLAGGVRQRGENEHPWIGRVGSGGRPDIAGKGVCGAASIFGIAASKRLGVGHAHFLEQCRRRRALDDAAGVHDGDLVGAPGDDTEIMRDQDHRHMPAALFTRQQIENLGLDGHVKCCGRFVGDQQLRLA